MGLTKSELIEKYGYRVRVIATKIARGLPPSEDLDDLISMGFIGLMDAADKFDPARGVKFETYSEYRIRGAIIDELRKQDWVPRTARARMNAVRHAQEELESRNGSRPTSLEISQQMDMPIEKFQELLNNLGSQTLVCLEDLPESREPEAAHESSPFHETVRKEVKAIVDRVLQELSEQERRVLNFYYYRGLNLQEIATILDLTLSRISQIHCQAVAKLQKKVRTRKTPAVENLFLALIDD